MIANLLQLGPFWAIVAAVLWSLAVILFRKAGERASPLALNLFKNLVALACYAPLVVWLTPALPSWTTRDWLLLAISGILGIAVADTMFFAALNRLGAGLNAIVSCLYFPALALQAFVFLGQAVPPKALVGGLLVISAIVIGAGGGPLPGTRRRDLVVGILIGAADVLIVGYGVILIEPMLHRSPVLFTTALRLLFGTLALLPMLGLRSLRQEVAQILVPSPWWRFAVPGAILGTALAMWAWLLGFAVSDNMAVIGVLNQLSTVFVFLLAAWLLSEPLTARRALAVALGFIGAAVVLA